VRLFTVYVQFRGLLISILAKSSRRGNLLDTRMYGDNNRQSGHKGCSTKGRFGNAKKITPQYNIIYIMRSPICHFIDHPIQVATILNRFDQTQTNVIQAERCTNQFRFQSLIFIIEFVFPSQQKINKKHNTFQT
jgi:hypothetical protein